VETIHNQNLIYSLMEFIGGALFGRLTFAGRINRF
jgi:hypothetical protein